MPNLHPSTAYCWGPCDRIVAKYALVPCDDCGDPICEDCRKPTSDPDLFVCPNCSHKQRRVMQKAASHAA